jgi:hypothetical protein
VCRFTRTGDLRRLEISNILGFDDGDDDDHDGDDGGDDAISVLVSPSYPLCRRCESRLGDASDSLRMRLYYSSDAVKVAHRL